MRPTALLSLLRSWKSIFKKRTGEMKKKRRKYRQGKVSAEQTAVQPLAPPLIGNPSTFSTKPWWSSDWWNLAADGSSNDIVSDFGTCGDLAIAASSVRGNSHRLEGTRCEDSFCITTGETLAGATFLVAVVGDGLGSAKYSAYGSKKVTYQFAQRLAEGLGQIKDLNQSAVNTVVSAIISPINNNVKSWSVGEHLAPLVPPEDVPVNELESTLTFVVIPAQGEKGLRPIYFGQIGDSPLFLLSGGQWHPIFYSVDTEPDTEDSAILDSRTEGVQGAESLLIGTRVLSDSDVLLISTDGVGNFISSGKENLAAGTHFAKEWRQPVSPSKFINDLHFNSKTADDDRTAVVCWFNRSQFDSLE